jgi:undecaprenyl-diphosphatase
MTAISFPGNIGPAVILSTLAIILVFISPLRQATIPMMLVLPADGLSLLLKDVVNRPRPSSLLVNVHQLLTDPGFPSSHVVHYTVFFGFLTFLILKSYLVPKQLRLPLATLTTSFVLLIPFSRMYLGVHWPTDVLAGYLLGASILVVQIRIFQKLQAAPQTTTP